MIATRNGVRRRAFWVAATCLGLSACIGGGGGSTVDVTPAPGAPPAAQVAGQGVQAPQGALGSGPVRIALLLPLTADGGAAATATSLRNAAELALSEFQNPDLTILVKDDRGTPEGAREAASQALGEGAELVLGPLFAGSVRAAGQAARGAGKPVIAFSTDASVAARGVYLLSFLAQAEVDRVIDHAAARGKKSVAALVPESVYGGVVEAQFREAAARRGLRVVAIERYGAGQGAAAVSRIQSLVTGPSAQADALFLPDNPDGLAAIGQALAQAGFDPQRVKPLGTGVWNDPRVFRIQALQGGWFAAPEASGYNAFADRYRAKYGSDPVRLATLAYDAVSLAAALSRQYGTQRFSESTLTAGSGFAGADGVFRFRADGTNDRALAVMEIRAGQIAAVSPAPKALSPNI